MIALDFGEVIAQGSPEEIVQHPAVIEAYIGRESPPWSRPMLLEVDKLSVSYGKAVALEEVTLRVGEGEFVAVLGPEWRRQEHIAEGDFARPACHRTPAVSRRIAASAAGA